MGMRQNIKLEYANGAPVFIYSHWDGDEDRNSSPLAHKLRIALSRKWRWDDESYLARIIVSEVLKEEIDGEVGYGIAPYPIDEEFPTIEVNMPNKTVNGMSYEKFINLYSV